MLKQPVMALPVQSFVLASLHSVSVCSVQYKDLLTPHDRRNSNAVQYKQVVLLVSYSHCPKAMSLSKGHVDTRIFKKSSRSFEKNEEGSANLRYRYCILQKMPPQAKCIAFSEESSPRTLT